MLTADFRRSFGAALGVAALVAACSSPAATTNGAGTTDATGDDATATLDALDGAVPTDATKDGGDGSSDVGVTDTSTDADAATDADGGGDADGSDVPDTGGTNCEFSKTPASGEPGATCTSNADCDSAVCVQGPEGKICTSTCTTCCPGGYTCAQAPGVDASFVCIPKQLALCAPCETDAECSKVDPGALCLSYGASGHFCGAACATNSDCPAGHACQTSGGQLGQAKQCVNTGGECTCSKLAIFKGASTSCSVTNDNGACNGSRKCTLTGLTACDAATPATETCNGLDDNCDGATDGPGSVGCVTYYKDSDGDGFGATLLGCLCSDPGTSATFGGDCNDGAPGVHPGAKEICDGIDNDCDGKTDPGFPDANGDGLADCVDSDMDGDGVINALDCSPTDAAVHPGAKEICDGIDNDCNGTTDDAGATGCTLWYEDIDGDGFGSSSSQCFCKATGSFTALTAGDCNDDNGAMFPGAEEFCNGKDDNCDGKTDAQDPSMILTKCALQAGVCAGAMHVASQCVAGAFQACKADDYTAYATAAGASYNADSETACDGTDNDCDGKTDEDFSVKGADGVAVAGVGAACGTGACAGGVTLCNPAQTATLCTTATATSAEVCDGVDNDCDGATDAADSDLAVVPCEKQAGVCSGAMHPADLCISGAWQICGNPVYGAHAANFEANTEVHCDGFDNDCDSKTDEDFTLVGPDGSVSQGVGATCGAGACASGTTVCADNSKAIVCPSAAQAAVEVCDGKDNDCDGLTDAADPDLAIVACDNQNGVCSGSQKPTALCQDGVWQACSTADYSAHAATYEATKELSCDALDNDCDGQIDEDFSVTLLNGGTVQGAGKACGVGACMGGTTTCTAAKTGIECLGEGAASAEVCDNVDNDCDGKLDAADSSMALATCDNQNGVCANSKHAAIECVLGGWMTCNAADYGANYESGATESLCDGLDGNCNGTVDDIGTLPLNANQVGACSGSVKKCTGAGGFVDNFATVPGYGLYEAPDGSFLDENCDGIDGTIAGAMFISQNGADAGNCSKSAPCKTLAYAIAAAPGTTNQDIYVMASGTAYSAFSIYAGKVRIWGGYDANWVRADRNVPGHAVTIQGALDVADQQVMAVKVRADDVKLEDLILVGIDATGDVGGNGKSSYVVYVKDAKGLEIQRCDFIQANGAPGVAGTNGMDASATAAGSGGNGGGASQYNTACDNSSRGGGGGGAGANPTCSGTGGSNGGSGGTMDSNCGVFSLNLNATNGNSGTALGSLPGGSGGGTCSVGGSGTSGGVNNGLGGGGTTKSSGVLSADYWAGLTGGNGGVGTAGSGGSGGGGSGGCDTGTDSYGAGGGGGGQGGCPAMSIATGGGAGGSSFGLFLVNTGGTTLTYTVSECTVVRGYGGNRGNGGVGGRGQSGGAGGNGGTGAGGSQPGGNGGHGGHGGHGGGAGGGAGGLSYGIFTPANAIGTFAGLSYIGGAPGTGGAGGASAPGAPLPEADGKPGSKGIDGPLPGAIMICAAPGGC